MSTFEQNVNALIEAMERSGAATTAELIEKVNAERERHAGQIGGDV